MIEPRRPAAAIAVALVLLLARPTAAEQSRDKMWAWSARAVGQLVQGERGAAVISLARAREAQDEPLLDAMVGLVALSGGETKAARRQLERAISRQVTEPDVLYWAGRAALHGGDLPAALQRVEQAVAVGGDRPMLRMAHALLLAARGRPREALIALQAVAASQPNLLDPELYPTPEHGAVELLAPLMRGFGPSAQRHATQGHLQWQLLRPLAALAHFRAVLKQRAQDADALHMSARCLAALGQHEAALELVARALKRAPARSAAYATRGALLLARGATRRAVADLRRAADAAPRDTDLLLQLAQACAEAEDAKCAQQFFTHAVRRDPQRAAAHFGMALLLQQAGEQERAAQAFERAIGLAPGNPRYYEAAAHGAQVVGQHARARRLLAAARAARVPHARHERQQRAAAAAAARMHQALVHCNCTAGRCATGLQPACGTALRRLAGPARAFFAAHLSLQRGQRPRGLTAILRRLSLRRLLGADPTLVRHRGTVGGVRYELRSISPMVPPGRVR